jgi:hypothetical protein
MMLRAALAIASLAAAAQAGKLSVQELDALARQYGYARTNVGAWQPPPPPVSETVTFVVRCLRWSSMLGGLADLVAAASWACPPLQCGAFDSGGMGAGLGCSCCVYV